MPQGATLRVDGLRQLNQAMARAPKVLKKEWRAGQRKIAEPTRRMAEYRALTEISNMPESVEWSRMRTGITQKVVYVAPKEKSRRARALLYARRPNLATLLMDRAMLPSLDHNAAQIMREFDGFLAAVGRDWER